MYNAKLNTTKVQHVPAKSFQRSETRSIGRVFEKKNKSLQAQTLFRNREQALFVDSRRGLIQVTKSASNVSRSIQNAGSKSRFTRKGSKTGWEQASWGALHARGTRIYDGKERPPVVVLPETRHHGLIKYNVRVARVAFATMNGNVRDDILIKGKVLLLGVVT